MATPRYTISAALKLTLYVFDTVMYYQQRYHCFSKNTLTFNMLQEWGFLTFSTNV
jgi:hypothetical protein